MNAAAALARLGGNTALLQEAAEVFLEECPRMIAELSDRLRRNDARGLGHAAHQMRGSLGCFAAHDAGAAAKILETTARAGDQAAAARAFAALQTALQRLTPALAALARPDGV